MPIELAAKALKVYCVEASRLLAPTVKGPVVSLTVPSTVVTPLPPMTGSAQRQ